MQSAKAAMAESKSDMVIHGHWAIYEISTFIMCMVSLFGQARPHTQHNGQGEAIP